MTARRNLIMQAMANVNGFCTEIRWLFHGNLSLSRAPQIIKNFLSPFKCPPNVFSQTVMLVPYGLLHGFVAVSVLEIRMWRPITYSGESEELRPCTAYVLKGFYVVRVA